MDFFLFAYPLPILPLEDGKRNSSPPGKLLLLFTITRFEIKIWS